MFGNNNQTQRQNQVSVNTHLFTSYSDTCMLKVGAWNQDVSLKFHPFKGTSANGFRTYAQDNSEIIITSIKHDNAIIFYKALCDVIDPAIKDNADASISIEAGAGETKKSITVSTTKDGVVSISVSVGINENGETTETNTLTHIFQTRTYFVGRDIIKGGGTPVVVQSDYLEFKDIFKHVFSYNTGNYHGIKLAKKIADVYASQRPSYGGGGYNNQSTQTYQAPTNAFSADNMSDFLPES